MPKLSLLGNLWDALTKGIDTQTAALRAQGEAKMPATGSLGQGRGTARDYLDPQQQSELDRLVSQKVQLLGMKGQGYSPEYASGLLKFGEEGMTQEARMARAAEQGFEGPFYRWTEGGQGNVIRTPESDKGLKFGPAGYASPQPEYGARYVDPSKANVQPLMARGPLADLNEVDRVSQGLIAQRKEAGLPQWPGHQQHWAEMQDALKAEGYRGVRYGDKEIASFEPEINMRSTSATFDPEGKGGLLGGLGGATVVGSGLLAGPQEAEAGAGSKILGQISDIGFFSPLERAVGGLSQQKGTGDQMLAMIQKQAGVKPEEVQWTGLGDFLANKPSVTKSEIEDYLINNRVDLQEVTLAGNNLATRFNPDTMMHELELPNGNVESFFSLNDLYNARAAASKKYNLSPKFERYTTPGGSNYRELLMTMPQKELPPTYSIRNNETGGTFGSFSTPEEAQQYMLSGPRAEEIRAGNFSVQQSSAGKEAGYKSSHFDQSNILAHTRVKDYTQDGQKILHVDEVQSDWHQAGRKHGYFKDPKPVLQESTLGELLASEDWRIRSHADTLRRLYIDNDPSFSGPYKNYLKPVDDIPVYTVIDKNNDQVLLSSLDKPPTEKRMKELAVEARQNRGDMPPDAPFKKNWHELMTRRILQEAADKGYSRVTFTTGRTQADRYDLSQQVRGIEWSGYKERGAEKLVTIRPIDGNPIELPVDADGVVSSRAGTQFDGKPLDEVVGKDMAKKIMDERYGELEGQGLNIGGEGMKGFYDNMMVKAFNKEGKKYGVKVEPYELKTGKDGEQVWSMEIPPEMRAKRKAEGSPMFAAAPFGLLGAGAMAPDKDAQAAMIAENIRKTPLSAFDLNRKPQAEMRAPRYGLLADIADKFEAGSRNDLLGSGESAAKVANALAYGQRPGVMDTIIGSFEAVDPITWASLLGAMSKGR